VPEGAVVLDPFLGSGTTALAARNLMRRYIGIEINPEYVAIACKRLQNRTPSLFE
jgi:DNA modification methylase